MQENSQPLAVFYGYQSSRNELSFVGRKGVITLAGKVTKIKRILRLCNGFTSVHDIAGCLPAMQEGEICEILNLLEKQGIVRDSRELFIGFHEDSANPALFSRDLGAGDVVPIMGTQRLRERDGKVFNLSQPASSHLLSVIRGRRSVRQFQDGQISGDKLSGLLEATYGLGKDGHWSVPSGGAMYPLDLYLIIPDGKQVLPRGVYRWNPEKSSVSLISGRDPKVWLAKALNARALLENAAYILCIAANLKRPALKYANRSYRNTLIEVGHAAQNTYLYCAEQGIGVVEYVGFCEEALAHELGLRFPDEAVITALIMGIEDQSGKKTYTADQQTTETARDLRLALVGDGKPIVSLSFMRPEVNGYAMPRWAATATYDPLLRVASSGCRSFATGHTSSEAIIKSLAEGFERYALEHPWNFKMAQAIELGESFLDPRTVVPYAPVQKKILKDIGCFDPHEEIEWIVGVREVSGARIWVPTELVFRANRHLKSRRVLCYHANSSGVAAHFDKQVAVEAALCELIERDAIGVTWYGKRQVYAIAPDCFPGDLRERVLRWEGFGYRVSFLNLTLEGPPVVLALIWSREKLPALVSGASCRPSFFEAADKAFTEAELMAMTWHRRRPRRKMLMNEIQSPDDHGLFYIDPRNLIYAKWLLEAEQKSADVKDCNVDLHLYNPIVVDITPEEPSCGLAVVRVLSERLMPINFGYGSEHYGHPRMAMLGLKWDAEYPSIPHFFA